MIPQSDSSFLHGPPQPLVVTIPTPAADPCDLYRRIASPSRSSVLLESGQTGSASARYSFLATDPYLALTGRGAHCVQRTGGLSRVTGEEPFHLLSRLIRQSHIARPPGLPPFFGGAIGYLSYDFVRRFETLPSMATIEREPPDLEFGFFDLTVGIDHQTGATYLMFCPPLDRFLHEPREKLLREGRDRLAELAARITASAPKHETRFRSETLLFNAQQSRESYMDRVRRCRQYIAAGDIYQANLSHRFSLDIPTLNTSVRDSAWDLYRRLRNVNPSPFAALVCFDGVQLVSCSPERLIRVQDRRVDTRPIAGTRPRGHTALEDRRLADELLASEKERAEHLMLVDLERNDLGKVCCYGSVRVNEFMAIERYSHVTHIVSNVSGLLRVDATQFDAIKALFPGGTITGVPKLRCMEIIEELEPVRRGLYTGALGYLSWSGDTDLNILIRTLVLSQEGAHLQVGAGIVADSDPASEYEETLCKAQAFFRALQKP